MLTERDLDRIVFGCGNFGGIGSSPSLRSAGDSEEQALRLLDHARRLGLRRFDTANTYGGGASEEVLGRWLRSQGASFLREVQIATKVGNPHGCPPGETPLGRAQIAWHLDVSLRRLGVERIDLYYVHEFDRVTPLDETMRGRYPRPSGCSSHRQSGAQSVAGLISASPRRMLFSKTLGWNLDVAAARTARDGLFIG